MGYLNKSNYIGENFSINLFSQTGNKTVTNTTVETSLLGAGVGSNTFSANFFHIGKSILIQASGLIAAHNAHTATLRIYFGGVKIVESVAIMPTTFLETEFQLNFILTYRGNNKFIGQGNTVILAGQAFATSYFRALKMSSEVTIDAAVSNSIDLTYQWGTASTEDVVTSTNCIIESSR